MTAPPGPVRLPRLTVTFEACDVAASSTTLNDTISFLAPKTLMQWPSHAPLATALVCPVARSSSRVTLSPPSFAHTAVMAEVPEVPPVSTAQGSPASPPAPAASTGPSPVGPSLGGAPSPVPPLPPSPELMRGDCAFVLLPHEAMGPSSAADADRVTRATSGDLTRRVETMRELLTKERPAWRGRAPRRADRRSAESKPPLRRRPPPRAPP